MSTSIQPLQLGKQFFPVNLIQGPLAGISCAPFRYLTWKYSQPAFSCTEMISCKTLIHQSPSILQRYIAKDPQEGPVCFQIAGNDPQEVGQATKIVTDFGADLIDLNCGCPVKKIRSKGYGSQLLRDANLLYKLITAMRQNTSVPISIKIRVDGLSDERFNREIANMIADSGLDFLVVHGRHWTQGYETPVHDEQIKFFVDQLQIPVIGNGDIATAATLQKILDVGCAGAMLSRAGVGQPWLIAQLVQQSKQNIFAKPSPVQIGEIFVEHISRLSRLLENEQLAILQARKLAKYYARTLDTQMPFCHAINDCLSLQAFTKICSSYFQNSAS